MKRILLLLFLILLIAVLIYDYSLENDDEIQRYQTLRKNCISLEIGMTKSEVLEIMGEPISQYYNEIDIMTADKWIYDDNSLNSTTLYCTFDSTNGKLVEKVCGE